MQRVPLNPSSIVDAAIVLADEQGFDAITLSAVARRLGVRPPSLYSHLRDVSALRDGVIESALRELNERIALSIAGRSGFDALQAFAEAHRRFAREAPGRWQALHRPAGAAAAESDAARTAVALTSAVLRGYSLPAAELVHTTRLLGATISGYLELERLGSFAHSEPHSEESWGRVLEALDSMLRSWPPTPDL